MLHFNAVCTSKCPHHFWTKECGGQTQILWNENSHLWEPQRVFCLQKIFMEVFTRWGSQSLQSFRVKVFQILDVTHMGSSVSFLDYFMFQKCFLIKRRLSHVQVQTLILWNGMIWPVFRLLKGLVFHSGRSVLLLVLSHCFEC